MRASGVPSLTILATCALVAGCSSGPSPQTTADLTRAQTLVSQAEATGARQYAAGELQAALDRVQQANELADRDSRRAGWLANEAAADAQLASARTQAAKAQHAVDNVSRSLQSLREETERSTNGAGAPGAGAAPAAEPNAPAEPSPRD
jgi:hypothetical protein